MSCCYTEQYVMPSADMGKENPLPDIKNVSYIHAKIDVSDAVPENRRDYINQGMIQTMLPYLQQDGYGRDRKMRRFISVVIENEFIKAVFLPELGGRLWSLTDKVKGKELLYRNPVFQPCNLALRNAWFSGGVEFNVSIKGHNPLTCEPLFAQRITMPDGSQGVRMFEYERIRGVAYSIDAWIPKGEKFLYIRPTIENRTGKDIWMYWWSNIAVAKCPGARVIAPARKTFVNYFGNDHYVLDYSDCPYTLGTDVSYPENLDRSLDFFYDIQDAEAKWIAHVDQNGYGLLQSSSSALKGRKLFVWGEGTGGKNWNQFLSDGSNDGYIEIQAGVARTQLEHVPMAAGTNWRWLEVYGAVDAGADAHRDWETAISAIEDQLKGHVTHALDGLVDMTAAAGEFLLYGSGWGALEEYRRKQLSLPGLSQEITFPDDSLTPVQTEWIDLIQKGTLAEKDPAEAPQGYVVDSFWHGRLKDAVETQGQCSWYALMHLGVMEYAHGNIENARKRFLQSVEAMPNAWCYRNLAMLCRNEDNDIESACRYMQKAVSLNNTCRGILIDTAVTYLQAGRYTQWLETYQQLGEEKKDGRLKLYCAKALMALERYEEAAGFLNNDLLMPDIKEGDTAISDTWFDLYEKLVAKKTGITDPQELRRIAQQRYPLNNLDFRTH